MLLINGVLKGKSLTYKRIDDAETEVFNTIDYRLEDGNDEILSGGAILVIKNGKLYGIVITPAFCQYFAYTKCLPYSYIEGEK